MSTEQARVVADAVATTTEVSAACGRWAAVSAAIESSAAQCVTTLARAVTPYHLSVSGCQAGEIGQRSLHVLSLVTLVGCSAPLPNKAAALLNEQHGRCFLRSVGTHRWAGHLSSGPQP